MILSASRRTDIPCFYSDWFFRRIKAGFVLVRNPMNPRQISKIPLNTETLDGIVFWTKNPQPMLSRLSALQGIPFYVQFTLTPYGKDTEPNLPDKETQLIPTFRQLSQLTGRSGVVWRYDPILCSSRYTPGFHKAQFAAYAAQLAPYTDTCVISFLDNYRKIQQKLSQAGIYSPTPAQRQELLASFTKTAALHGISLQSCCEDTGGLAFPVLPACCIDKKRLETVGGVPLNLSRDKNQRPLCGCAESIDLGMYHSCGNGCLYCYANISAATVQRNMELHNPASALLYGEVQPGDIIKPRNVVSHRNNQISLF